MPAATPELRRVFALALPIAGCLSQAVPSARPPLAAVPGPAASSASAAPAASATLEAAPPDSEPEHIADESEEEQPEPVGAARPHPLDSWTAEALARAVRDDLPTLGSISIGRPSAGALLNGVRPESGPLLELVDARAAWGTKETVDALLRAIQSVHDRFPNTPPLFLGHISDENGGPLRPHASHQSGRDVDISFYYKDGARWYARADERTLDTERTWAFVRALVTETDVEMILVDTAIERLLERCAREQGEDTAWLDSIFHGRRAELPAIVRYAPGHATHLHVRFYNPIAQETARRVGPVLVESGRSPKLTAFVQHRARSGDTLGRLAKKYATSVRAIQDANGLRTSKIREGRVYRIPVPARPSAPEAPLTFPARRLPPGTATAAARGG